MNSNQTYQDRRDYLTKLIAKLNSRKTYLQKISRNYSYFRLSILLTELVLFFILFFFVSNTSTLISLAIFIILFSISAHYHSKVDRGIKKLDVWIEIKKTHIDRLNLDWDNIPSLNIPSEKHQPNEIDLDITGDDSLLQLINTTTSKQSKSLLRAWLNSKTHNVDEIIKRQNLIKELISQTTFRDKLKLNSILSSRLEFDGQAINKILNYIEKSPEYLKFNLIILSILAPINVLLFVMYLYNLLPAFWGITLLIYYILFRYTNKDKEKFKDETDIVLEELGKIEAVFWFLERYQHKKSSKLSELCEPFMSNQQKPSFIINKLKNSFEFLRIRKGNPLVWYMIRATFPIDIYLKLRIRKYKYFIKDKLNIWLDTWYNLEALSSFANFAYLNPGYTFPKIIESKSNEIIFKCKQIGHPLIKNEKKICNDFSFNPSGEIALITGSNMSGKSTFIRTLGINLSLAYAGSVVNADEFEVSLFDLFTCIRINDSLTESISYFYAEVKRLKALLDEIEISDYPVFFLIDEIFRGTNNIERLKGSSMYIKQLAKSNAVGAIATHDLELVNLSETISKVKNYHFKEEVKNGKMLFDYKINPGPCPTTNALKIMKLAGLPVEE